MFYLILQWISLVRRRQMPSKSDTVVMIDEERVLAAIDEDTVKSYAMNEAAVITDTNWKEKDFPILLADFPILMIRVSNF